jgi:hypothetical protein
MHAFRHIDEDASLWAGWEPRSVALGSCRRRVMHGHKTRLSSVAHSSIADWFALNSNELTWIALVTVGVIAVGMSM